MYAFNVRFKLLEYIFVIELTIDVKNIIKMLFNCLIFPVFLEQKTAAHNNLQVL